jgi:hypothetical protein
MYINKAHLHDKNSLHNELIENPIQNKLKKKEK